MSFSITQAKLVVTNSRIYVENIQCNTVKARLTKLQRPSFNSTIRFLHLYRRRSLVTLMSLNESECEPTIEVMVVDKDVTDITSLTNFIPFASLAFRIASDLMKRTIRAGKESRGSINDDPYKFGDFTRGICSLPRILAKKGGMIRRGEFDHYKLGDFTCGLLSSVKKYVIKHKREFGIEIINALYVLIDPMGVILGIIVQ